jgi:hypothetical protein
MTTQTSILFGAFALVMGASAASADRVATLSERLAAQGWSDIEISREDGTIRIEAERRDREIEIVLDAASGRVLSREIDDADEAGPRDDDDRPGKSKGKGKGKDRDDDATDGRDDDGTDDDMDDDKDEDGESEDDGEDGSDDDGSDDDGRDD